MNENEIKLAALESKLKVSFSNKSLLQQAFIHRSYINEHRSLQLSHNERLEFLGDAVLELIVTEYLFENYPNPEGELTNWRSALVKGETLAEIATELDFSSHLMVSKGEAKSGGRQKNALLANAFEAVIGALYVDQGYEMCRNVVHENVLTRLPRILEEKLYRDPKSHLQEYAQEKFGITPTYVLVGEEGPDHAKQFTVAVSLGDKEIARGQGGSKQSGQVAAAEQALLKLTQEESEV